MSSRARHDILSLLLSTCRPSLLVLFSLSTSDDNAMDVIFRCCTPTFCVTDTFRSCEAGRTIHHTSTALGEVKASRPNTMGPGFARLSAPSCFESVPFTFCSLTVLACLPACMCVLSQTALPTSCTIVRKKLRCRKKKRNKRPGKDDVDDGRRRRREEKEEEKDDDDGGKEPRQLQAILTPAGGTDPQTSVVKIPA